MLQVSRETWALCLWMKQQLLATAASASWSPCPDVVKLSSPFDLARGVQWQLSFLGSCKYLFCIAINVFFSSDFSHSAFRLLAWLAMSLKIHCYHISTPDMQLYFCFLTFRWVTVVWIVVLLSVGFPFILTCEAPQTLKHHVPGCFVPLGPAYTLGRPG